MGQKVSFIDDGVTYKGKVKSIKDDYSVIATSDNEEWEILLDDLTAL